MSPLIDFDRIRKQRARAHVWDPLTKLSLQRKVQRSQQLSSSPMFSRLSHARPVDESAIDGIRNGCIRIGGGELCLLFVSLQASRETENWFWRRSQLQLVDYVTDDVRCHRLTVHTRLLRLFERGRCDGLGLRGQVHGDQIRRLCQEEETSDHTFYNSNHDCKGALTGSRIE